MERGTKGGREREKITWNFCFFKLLCYFLCFSFCLHNPISLTPRKLLPEELHIFIFLLIKQVLSNEWESINWPFPQQLLTKSEQNLYQFLEQWLWCPDSVTSRYNLPWSLCPFNVPFFIRKWKCCFRKHIKLLEYLQFIKTIKSLRMEY